MSTRPRRWRPPALAVALAMAAAGCSGDESSSSTQPADDRTTTTAGREDASTTTDDEPDRTTADPTTAPDSTTGVTRGTTGGATDRTDGEDRDAAMTVTIELDPRAVWEDGTPITVADLACTWRANLNTPGSIRSEAYEPIMAVSAGDTDQQVIVEFDEVVGAYKTLFNPILKAAAVADCDDVSADFATTQPVSARPYRLESWDEQRAVLVPNENYWGDDTARAARVVFVPQRDPVAALLAGQVDVILPPLSEAVAAVGDDPAVELAVAAGGEYEALYFQQLEGPFADPVFRAAFSMSIDRQALYDEVYAPIFAAGGVTGELLDCGPAVAPPWCPERNFAETFDPVAATTLLTEAGWVRDVAGRWTKDGVVPRVVWVANAGDERRQRTQEHLIPLLAEAGFDVVADNCDAACVFDQRLPALDYDLAMYLSAARPDPAYLQPLFSCESIPTEETDFQGRNQQGWCNQAASEALRGAAETTDEDDRVELVQRALRAMATDHVLLPLVNYPRVAVWRTDRVGGPVGAELGNDRSFAANLSTWQDVDGDGQILVGAGQWPTCLNPVTECADSSWYLWTVAFSTLPGVWDTTADQGFEATDLVIGEPEVQLAE